MNETVTSTITTIDSAAQGLIEAIGLGQPLTIALAIVTLLASVLALRPIATILDKSSFDWALPALRVVMLVLAAIVGAMAIGGSVVEGLGAGLTAVITSGAVSRLWKEITD
ncbi:MAG: hypothetical protein HC927_01235 [Deltaproteobacteria bacterium]|nr:hypothetical protein [Deltaproteobacteria bacterium]